jgi:hypothetical protein
MEDYPEAFVYSSVATVDTSKQMDRWLLIFPADLYRKCGKIVSLDLPS